MEGCCKRLATLPTTINKETAGHADRSLVADPKGNYLRGRETYFGFSTGGGGAVQIFLAYQWDRNVKLA
jgi:hypothetical protein